MSLEDPGSASFAGIGGLNDQVRELREVIELPLMNPELFEVRPASRVRIIMTESNLANAIILLRGHSEWVSVLQRESCFMVLQGLERLCSRERSPQPSIPIS